MDRIFVILDKPHFHIRWSASKRLDWECFDTYEEAEKRALELLHIGERFAIEEVPAQCSACIPHLAS